MALVQSVIRTTLAVLLTVSAAGCGFHYSALPTGSLAGRAGVYDYSPSVIQSGNVRQIWWCGASYNPKAKTQFSDSIQYESFDLTANTHFGPVAALSETPNGWDAVYTCNPKVVQGSFQNPLGNGQNYSYAMYYVGLGSSPQGNNSIGVAFSRDGVSWAKYPHPIILPSSSVGYGVGQPAVYNINHNSAIRMFYEVSNLYTSHVEAISSDGVHFTNLGTLTTNGLDPDNPQASWGDMAYDGTTGYWYATFNFAPRDEYTTGMMIERGQYGIQLYRIADASLLTGSSPWQLLTTIDTCLTGYEANFLAGLVRDPFGNLNVGMYPTLQMAMSISNPRPPWNASPAQAGASADTLHWDIAMTSWVPNQPLRTLSRYFNQTAHEVTTGWIDPQAGFSVQSMLGHLYEGPQNGATVAFYSCKNGSTDYFVSRDANCGGARILGTEGYGYAKPVAGLNLVALYECATGMDDFVSNDIGCEGQATGRLLGFALP